MTGRRRPGSRGSASSPFSILQTTAFLVLLAALLAFTAPLAGAFPASDIDDVRVAPPRAGDVGIIAVASPTKVHAPEITTSGASQRDRKRTSSLTKKGQGHLLEQPVSSENVIRPLENIADRFMKSTTVGVVDSIASHAIEAFARFVDGAGLVMVDIIDSLPGTIDRVADTVDGMVKTADDIGRNVAVIVTAPARIVMTGLNPEFNPDLNRTQKRRGALDTRNNEVDNDSLRTSKNNTEKSVDNGTNSRRAFQRRQESLIANMFNQRRQALNDRDTPRFSLFNRINNGSASNLQQILSRSLDDSNSNLNVIRSRISGRARAENQKSDADTSDSNVFSTRSLGRSLLRSSLMTGTDQESDDRSNRPSLNLLGFGTLGSAFALRNRTRGRGQSSEEREKNVFEKNFEASKTQASIDKLEEEFGGFLGRLLGTIYRNADPIDESISGGLRRVLGAAPLTASERRNRFRGGGRGVSSAGDATSSSLASAVTTTSTPPPVKFRLTFDDIDPAPARNVDAFRP